MQEKIIYDLKSLITTDGGAYRMILSFLIFSVGIWLIFLEGITGGTIYYVKNSSNDAIVSELAELIHFYPDTVEVTSVKLTAPFLGGMDEGQLSIYVKLPLEQSNSFKIIDPIHYFRDETYVSYIKTPLNMIWPFYTVQYDYGSASHSIKTEAPELYNKIWNLVDNVSKAGEPIQFTYQRAVPKLCLVLVLSLLPFIRHRQAFRYFHTLLPGRQHRKDST